MASHIWESMWNFFAQTFTFMKQDRRLSRQVSPGHVSQSCCAAWCWNAPQNFDQLTSQAPYFRFQSQSQIYWQLQWASIVFTDSTVSSSECVLSLQLWQNIKSLKIYLMAPYLSMQLHFNGSKSYPLQYYFIFRFSLVVGINKNAFLVKERYRRSQDKTKY